MTKLIIAGGRDFDNYTLLEQEVKRFIIENNIRKPLSIVSGKARGADKMGEQFANQWKFPIISMPADWNKYGNTAGPIRNEEMAKIATHCIVFWDGKSSGSANMIQNAKKYNLIYKVINY